MAFSWHIFGIFIISLIVNSCSSYVQHGNQCGEELCIFIQPDYAEVNVTSVSISCVIPAGIESQYSVTVSPPWHNNICSADCYFYSPETGVDDCWDLSEVSYCDCNNTRTEDLDQPCDIGTTVVKFNIKTTFTHHFGTWTCYYTSIKSTSYLLEYVECSIKLDGPETVVVGTISEFNCTAEKGKPAAEIVWYLRDTGNKDTDITMNSTSDSIDNGDNTTTVISTLFYHPQKTHNEYSVYCTAFQLEGKPELESSLKQLNVQYKPEVTLYVNDAIRTEQYRVLKHDPVILHCDWNDGKPEDNKEFVFYKDDLELQRGPNDVFETPTIEDSGTYQCEANNEAGTSNRQGTDIQVLIPSNITNLPTTVEVSLNVSNEFTCEAEGDQPITYTWLRNGEEFQPGQVLNLTETEESDNGTYVCKATNTLNPTDTGEQDYHSEQPLSVMVKFPAKVSIGPCSEVLVVEKDTKVILSCTVLDAYPAVETFVWKKDSTTIDGEVESTYKVSDNIQPQNEGIYSCTGVNHEPGAVDSILDLQVHYHPENTNINGTAQSLELLENSTLSLLCETQAKPAASYQWSYPGSTGDDVNDLLTVKNIQYTQAGNYTCTVSNSLKLCGEQDDIPGYEAVNKSVLILHNPKGSPGLSSSSETICVEEELNVICDLQNLDSMGWPFAPFVIWLKEGSEAVSENITISDPGEDVGEVPWKFYSVSVMDSGKYFCQAQNWVGSSDMSGHIEITVEAPATIEHHKTNTNKPKYNGDNPDTLVINCTVSASNNAEIYWKHNDKDIENGTKYDISDPVVLDGQYSYGLDNAQKKELRWKAEPLTCAEIDIYDGDYVCYGSAVTACVESTVSSSIITVETQYAAIWDGESDSQLAEYGAENYVLQCPHCANPEPSIQWYKSGIIIEGAIQQNYTLYKVNDTDFTFYQCVVTNDVGVQNFSIELKESGPAGDPHNLTVLQNETSSSVTLFWKLGRDGNHPPVNHFIDMSNSSSGHCETNNDFILIDNISENGSEYKEMNFIVEGLEPSTKYDIRLQAVNTKSNEPESNYQFFCDAATKDVPHFDEWDAEVHGDKIIITWKYGGREHQQENEVLVGLKFIYSSEGEDEQFYPVEGTVPATDPMAEIPGDFNDGVSYRITAIMYEGNNTLGTTVQEGNSQINSGMEVGGIVGILLVTLLLVLVVLGYIAYRNDKIPFVNKDTADDQSSTTSDNDDRQFDNPGLSAEDEDNANKDPMSPGSNVYVDSEDIGDTSQLYAEVNKPKKDTSQLYAEVKKPKKVMFTKPLQSNTVAEGSSAVFSCKVNQSGKEIRWQFQGRDIDISQRHIYYIDQTSLQSQLTIFDCTLQDVGKYTAICDDVRTSAELKVIPASKPAVPKKSKKSNTTVQSEDESMDLVGNHDNTSSGPKQLIYTEVAFDVKPKPSTPAKPVAPSEDPTIYADIDFMPPFEESNRIPFHNMDDDIIGLLDSDMDTDSDVSD